MLRCCAWFHNAHVMLDHVILEETMSSFLLSNSTRKYKMMDTAACSCGILCLKISSNLSTHSLIYIVAILQISEQLIPSGKINEVSLLSLDLSKEHKTVGHYYICDRLRENSPC